MKKAQSDSAATTPAPDDLIARVWSRYKGEIPTRIVALAALSIYVFAFNSSYIDFVGPRYAFMGMGVRPVDPAYILVSWM